MEFLSITIAQDFNIRLPTLLGNYRLMRLIGQGSTSAVFLANHIKTGDFYGLKIVPRSLLEKNNLLCRFEQELRVQQSLSHQNLLALHDIIYNENIIGLVMDYCRNGDLYSYLVNHDRLPEIEARNIFIGILEGLYYLHSKEIAHRDIKPENILLDEDLTPKIADLGLCHTTYNSLLSTPCGSPFYVPPEVLNLEQYDGKKRDIWSLGIVLFAMVTSSLPWTELSQTALFSQIKNCDYVIPDFLSTRLQNLIRKMINNNPDDRPTCQEIFEDPWITGVDNSRKLQFGNMLGKNVESSENMTSQIIQETAKSHVRKQISIVIPKFAKVRSNSSKGEPMRPIHVLIRKKPTSGSIPPEKRLSSTFC